ncbi:hypothetical protein D3C87_1112520 [compost metagenome]
MPAVPVATKVGFGYVPVKSPPAAPVGAAPVEAIVMVPSPFVTETPVPAVIVAFARVPSVLPINN